jgi:dienelactone hydrolase
MLPVLRRTTVAVLLLCAARALAADPPELAPLLSREIIGPLLAMSEVQAYCESRVPAMPELTTLDEWEKHAKRVRTGVLEKVVFRGEARAWRDANAKVEWLDSIEGGPGYRIRKLRYEALPGLWIPALLYEPDKLSGKVPAVLNVNGHDGNGKAAPYKQVRCINLAKRGMLALNVEWLGMGQLNDAGYGHYRMNQLDLCGTSGLAPFYLAMSRAIDLLLAHEHADPRRLAVTGLSGGGWQTIIISSLDTRVQLTNPVAGYSSFKTRVRNLSDLGDSEQTPSDLATAADYAHLTALMAPRPTLLTFNSKDECCFASGHAMQPLVDAASPVFALYGKPDALRTHVNDEPGTHNYEKDNRQAFYRMVGDHFFAGDSSYSADEVPSDGEVKSKEALAVELPTPNANFNSLALSLAKALPKDPDLPRDKAAAEGWQRDRRAKLRDVVRFKDYDVKARRAAADEKGELKVTYWRLKMNEEWTVPAVELVRGEPKATAVLVSDTGRAKSADAVSKLLDEGHRVVAVDPFYFGESKIEKRDHLFALLVAAVGDRPLGIQAGQVAAVARWCREKHGAPVTVVAVGPRSSTFALVAAAVEEKAVAGVRLHNSLGSLKEVIEQGRGVDKMPEMFCFGLLESFDVVQMAALVAPRPVEFAEPSERVKQETAPLNDWHSTLGAQ